jgi:hypothetical protein
VSTRIDERVVDEEGLFMAGAQQLPKNFSELYQKI